MEEVQAYALKRLLHGGSDEDKDQTVNQIIQGVAIVIILAIGLIFGLIPYFV